ncbi:LAQU0S03e07932g1_1 [Lachancea quebecensis]|uniref:LAQU0S03e07932g1_1 n=1 Tax=Lachancea quebecensis TaxID=1654605 RepID=A0A0P1KRX5_9SACH|nr:LAQU0S03e07932g1_1 [Lachancea quebecensis]
MDRLQQLEEKKRKLQELRERRRHAQAPNTSSSSDGLVKHLLRTTTNVPKVITETVSVGTQTENFEDAEVPNHASEAFPGLITYEKGIQTEAVEFKEEEVCEESQDVSVADVLAEEEASKSPRSPGSPEEHMEAAAKPRAVVPYVVENQALTIGTRSFSLLEALDQDRLSLTQKELDNMQHFHVTHSLGPALLLAGGAKCVWVDYYAELSLAVLQHADENAPQSTNSVVAVYKLNTAELVDAVEFRGQALLRGEFLRRKGSKVMSVLLTSYNGKTILYEMRAAAGADGSLAVERNITTRNYHHYPALALWQYHTTEPRVLVGSTDGTVSELDVLTMEPYRDPTSSGFSSHFKVAPLPPSALIDEGDASEETKIQSLFKPQLERLSRYDEVAVTSIVTMPQDPGMLYLGCEDGGIYKVNTHGLESRSVPVDVQNNGFVPGAQAPVPMKAHTDHYETSLFHSLPVTGLYICRSAPNLLLSSSMDWECAVWDVVNCKRVTRIELDHPVVSCEWVNYEERHYVFVLTPAALQVYDLRLLPEFSSTGEVAWSAPKRPVELFSIGVENCEGFSFFASFKTLQERNRFFVVLGGDSAIQHCAEVLLHD